MVLTNTEILKRIDNSEHHEHKFIDPVIIDNVKSASYDLTLGDEYYICSESSKPDIKRIREDDSITVPPRATFFVISKEKLCIPLDLCASVSLAFGLIKRGVLLAEQPPIDPGYHGAIIALLHNMSDEAIVLQKGMHILNIVYYKLTNQVSNKDGYKGKYADITLEKFCTEAVTHSAIVNLAKEAKEARDKAETASKEAKDASEEAKKSSHKALTTIITIITVLLAIITVFLTVTTILISIRAVQSTPVQQINSTYQAEEAASSGLGNQI